MLYNTWGIHHVIQIISAFSSVFGSSLVQTWLHLALLIIVYLIWHLTPLCLDSVSLDWHWTLHCSLGGSQGLIWSGIWQFLPQLLYCTAECLTSFTVPVGNITLASLSQSYWRPILYCSWHFEKHQLSYRCPQSVLATLKHACIMIHLILRGEKRGNASMPSFLRTDRPYFPLVLALLSHFSFIVL